MLAFLDEVVATSGGEYRLLSYTLPPDTLASNLAGIRIKAYGSFANDASPKQLSLTFGGALCLSTGAQPFWGNAWLIDAHLLRVGDVVRCMATILPARSTNPNGMRPSLTQVPARFDEALEVAIVASGGVDSVVQHALIVEYVSA